MADTTNKVIKITVDTKKAKIEIEGVEGYFRKATTAAKALNGVLEQNTQKWGRTEAALRNQIASLTSLRSNTAGTTEEYKRQTAEIDKLEAELSQLTGAQQKAVKGMGSMESSAGIAGATVNELGRTISDMPFGITAVTNNISQLGSMFAILVQKTGSVNKALKSLFLTLKASPALVALLAFQAAVAALELFAQSSRKAEKATKDLNSVIGESAVELKIARDLINNSSTSFIKKQEAINQVNSEYKELNLRLDENGQVTRQSTLALDSQIESLEKMAKTQAIVNQVQSLYGEIAVLTAKTGSEVATFWDQLAARSKATSLFPALFGFGANTKNAIEEEGNKTKDELIAKTQETIDALIKQIDSSFIKQSETKKSVKNSIDEINLQIVQQEIEYIESISKVTEEGQLKMLDRVTELERLELEIQERMAIAKAKEEERSQAELLAIESIYAKKREVLINNSNASRLAIMKSFHSELKVESQKAAEDQLKELEFLIPPKELVDKSAKEAMDGLAAYQKRRDDATKNGNEAVANLREQDKLHAVWAAQDLTNAVADVMSASFQREIDMERDKTNIKNNELKKRLADENLSAEERKKIQRQIAGNDEALRVKQEAIEKKKFKLNKAASIANATVNTYLAATAALKDPALSTFQRVASMVAIIGSGLAQVAVIAKQKFVSSQSGLGGGAATGAGSTGANVQAPDFNIVGQSNVNQLAEVVSSQLDKPIKTYVVTKDVSTAQSMERNIVNGASIG